MRTVGDRGRDRHESVSWEYVRSSSGDIDSMSETERVLFSSCLSDGVEDEW